MANDLLNPAQVMKSPSPLIAGYGVGRRFRELLVVNTSWCWEGGVLGEGTEIPPYLALRISSI